eukprot:scaffold19019_cov82-Skeletonema_dohrnii-CCMP3373.AAC.1
MSSAASSGGNGNWRTVCFDTSSIPPMETGKRPPIDIMRSLYGMRILLSGCGNNIQLMEQEQNINCLCQMTFLSLYISGTVTAEDFSRESLDLPVLECVGAPRLNLRRMKNY